MNTDYWIPIFEWFVNEGTISDVRQFVDYQPQQT